MDQLKFNNVNETRRKEEEITLPRRKFTMEFFVGLFALVGVGAAGYLSVGLGHLDIGMSGRYTVYGEFDNISGLKKGASVEIAGVQVGEVSELTLKDPTAIVTMRLNKSVKIKDDDIASIRTKGIIGDRYVKISRGASDQFIPENGKIIETESVVDLEDVIGKIVHNLGNGDKESKDEEKAADAEPLAGQPGPGK